MCKYSNIFFKSYGFFLISHELGRFVHEMAFFVCYYKLLSHYYFLSVDHIDAWWQSLQNIFHGSLVVTCFH